MNPPTFNWFAKFSNAIRGILISVRDQTSFRLHLPIAAAVLIASIILQVSMTQLLVLMICIAGVLVAELFNSSLEQMAKAITDAQNSRIRDALDIAAGAVLLSALSSAVIGTIVFGQRIYELLSG